MSNTNVISGVLPVIELLPEEIVVNEDINVRPWEGDAKAEQERIERLARTIDQEGQLQAGLVNEVKTDAGVEYHLIAGNRRRNAIALLNAALPAGAEPRKMRVEVHSGLSLQSAFRKAAIENLHRENFNPMDLCLDILRVREMHGWTTGKDTKKVADYFGVSTATITTHEKLKTLPTDIQAKVAAGLLSAQAAFDLVDVKPDKRAEVMQEAERRQAEEDARKAKASNAKPQPVTGKGKTNKGGGGKEPPEEKGKINRKHVAAASREVEGATDKPKARSKGEVVEFFRMVADSPAYGYANSPVRSFANFFVDKWVPAIGAGKSDRSLTTRFDAMVFDGEGSLLTGEGTPNKEEVAAEEAATKAKGEKAEKAEGKGKAGKGKGKAA